MAKYLDRKSVLKALKALRADENDYSDLYHDGYVDGVYDAEDAVKGLPSEDVQPVRHGHWETIEGWDGDELYRCSECGAEFVLIDGTPEDNDYWFCPHCGADMRGEQNDG